MNMLCRRTLPARWFPAIAWMAGACLLASPLRAQDAAIKQVLSDQSAAWNRGDLDAFMEGYAKTPDLRFASGGAVTKGWQETLARYKGRYADRAAMGTLAFSDLDVTILAPDTALVFGRWRLKNDKGEPNGLFTLLFRKTDGGWRIVADHTSAAD